MTAYGVPVLYALLVWWFSTGAVLYAIGMPRRTHGLTMMIATALLVLSFVALSVTSGDASTTGAFHAFTAAIVAWGWHEASFLLDYVTGPRRTPLSSAPAGMSRLQAATETVIYHEIAIALTAVAIGALTYEGANQTGFWTFVVLWLMRLSAKLNVYLGVPNLTEEFLPDHLTYLKTYFRNRPMNLFFPLTVTLSTAATTWLVLEAVDPAASTYDVTFYALISSLMALAVIEHWFLVVPIPAAALWAWGMTSREQPLAQGSGVSAVATPAKQAVAAG